jgi:transposase
MAKTIQAADADHKKHELLTKVLQLEDLDIVKEEYDITSNHLYLYCVPRRNIAPCPSCSQLSQKVHDYPKERHIHDTLLGGKKTVLIFDATRFGCEKCKRPFTQTIRDVVPECTYTYRLYEETSNPKRKQDVATLAKLYGVGYKVVESIVLKRGEKLVCAQ